MNTKSRRRLNNRLNLWVTNFHVADLGVTNLGRALRSIDSIFETKQLSRIESDDIFVFHAVLLADFFRFSQVTFIPYKMHLW